MAKKVRKIYYARALQMFGTPEDRANIEAIQEAYPGAQIDFANFGDHGRGPRGGRKSGQEPPTMDSFFDRVDAADLVVTAPQKFGMMTSGVASEALHALHRKKQVRTVGLRRNRRVESIQVRAGKADLQQNGKWARAKYVKPKPKTKKR